MNKIAKIQSDYVELLDSYLQPLGKEAVQDHIQAGRRYSTIPYLSDVLLAYYESLPQDISDFWRANASDLHKAIIEQNSLRLCYSGDLSPSSASNLVKRLGLYVDTILIPDPVFNITHQLNQITSRQFYLRSLIRHSLNIVSLKALLTADLDIPIVATYPSTEIYNPSFMNPAREQAKIDTVHYLNATFDLRLKDTDDPLEVMAGFKKPEDLIKLLVKPDNLIPDLREPTIHEGFKDFVEQDRASLVAKFANRNAGEQLCGYLLGRLLSFHDHFANCKKYGGEPIYDSPNSWKMFTWYLDDVFPQGNILSNQGLVANSIGINNPQWIGKLSDEKLIETRANNELHDIREVMTNGINRMRMSPDKDLDQVTATVQKNLKEAFLEHQKEVGAIDRRLRKKYLINYPLIAVGSLLAYIPSLPYKIAAGIALPFSLAAFYGIRKDKKQITSSKQQGRLIGMMYDSAD